LVVVAAAVWAATERARHPPTWRVRPLDPTESGFAALLLLLLFAVGVQTYDYPTVSMRAAATEAVGLSVGQRICMQEIWAVSGELPAASACEQAGSSRDYVGAHVTAIIAPSNQPEFEYVFGTRATPKIGPRLSVTLTAGPGAPPATLAWRCGAAPVAARMTALAQDHSTLPWRARPSFCREAWTHGTAR